MKTRVVPLLLVVMATALLAAAMRPALFADTRAPATIAGRPTAPAVPWSDDLALPVAWLGDADAEPGSTLSAPRSETPAVGAILSTGGEHKGNTSSCAMTASAVPRAAEQPRKASTVSPADEFLLNDRTARPKFVCAGETRTASAVTGIVATGNDFPAVGTPAPTMAASSWVAGGKQVTTSQQRTRPLSLSEIEALTAQVVADLDSYWQTIFIAEGRHYELPTYQLIAGLTPTPCAWDGAVEPGAGSFYCPWNQTIYLDVAAIQLETGRYGAAGLLFTLAHEWGHHAQFQRGELQERSAEVELTADCLAGAYLADAVARGVLSAEAVEKALPVILANLDEGADAGVASHGSGAQRATMLMLGYTEGLPACIG